MAIQWVIVCTQDVAPSVTGGVLDCGAGTAQVVPYQYLNADSQAFGSLLNLSNADATAIGFAVLSVWAAAWSVKMVIRSLGSFKNDEVE